MFYRTTVNLSAIQHIIRDKRDGTFFQFIRYTFVGGFAFLVDFGILFLLTEYLNIYYLFSAGIAFSAGLTINYILSIRWVFTRRTFNNRALEFLLFTFIGLAGLALNELFIWFFTEVLLIYYLVSKILTTIIVYLWNFFVRKLILFNK